MAFKPLKPYWWFYVQKYGSKVSGLMELFSKDDAYNLNDFPVTSKIKARFKLDDEAGKR